MPLKEPEIPKYIKSCSTALRTAIDECEHIKTMRPSASSASAAVRPSFSLNRVDKFLSDEIAKVLGVPFS